MTKSNLVETKQTFGSITSSCGCAIEHCSTTSSPFFVFNTRNLIFFSNALSFLYGAISESVDSNFTLILFSIFVIYWFFKQFLGILWSPHFCRGSCQLCYLAPRSAVPPAWNIKNPVSIICKHCLLKGSLSDNFSYFLSFFDWYNLCF